MEKPVLTQKEQDRLRTLTQLYVAEQATADFRRAGNWQRYSEQCEECARLGRLLRLDEMQKD